MGKWSYLIILYVLAINSIAFLIMAVDKNRAKKNEWRISEKSIWTFAFLGGSIGVYAGMRQFRHKTKHMKFKYGIPLIMVLEYAVFVYFCLVKLA